MQTESTRTIQRPDEEIDSLMEEFDRIDEAIGGFLVAEARRGRRGNGVRPSARWLRARIRDWCRTAQADGAFESELVATTEMALRQLEDHLLVPLAIDLMDQAQQGPRLRNHSDRRRIG